MQGVADGIDAATASKAVRAIVLRGEGRVFTAGYDLVAAGTERWKTPYDAPSVEPRAGRLGSGSRLAVHGTTTSSGS